MTPDVSLIVVNFRSAELTERALGLAAASAAPHTVQEIVVDNASGADEVQRLRAARPQAEVVALDVNGGFAAGNNAGIARARGRHLLLLNPDAFCEGDAVARLVARLDASARTGVAAPRLQFADGSRQDNAYRRFPNHATLLVDYCAPLAHVLARTPYDPHRFWHRRLTGEAVTVVHVTGAALLVRAAAARDAGPLDEGYFLYYEETEWQRRIASTGWTIEVVPGALVTHLGGASTGSFALASPHYLASVRRYFGATRRSAAIVRGGALVSWLALSAAGRLGVRSPALAAQARGYREVLYRLRHGWGGAAR